MTATNNKSSNNNNKSMIWIYWITILALCLLQQFSSFAEWSTCGHVHKSFADQQAAGVPPPHTGPTTLPSTSLRTASSSSSSESFKGIHPVYMNLLKEAEKRSAADYAISHQRGKQGFVIGPIGGNVNHAVKAFQNAKRLQTVLSMTNATNTYKIAIMASPEQVQVIHKCNHPHDNNTTTVVEQPPTNAELCRLWANGTLLDDLIATQPGLYKGNESHQHNQSGTAEYWLTALSGYRFAPYQQTIFLDSDAFPCPGVERLFDIAGPRSKYWQLESYATTDFAAGMDQFPFAAWDNHWVPGDDSIAKAFRQFRERNTGTVFFNFERPMAHTFAHFIPLVGEYVYNHVATPKQPVVHDQVPLRIAHFVFQHVHGADFVDQILPMHTSCRAYPGFNGAGTDAFANGMYPLQSNGQHCNQCNCTPCLINHHKTMPVFLYDNVLGWEEDLA